MSRVLQRLVISISLLLLAFPFPASSDVVTDTCSRTTAVIAGARLPTPIGNRAAALAQTAIYEAVNAITRKYPSGRFNIKANAGDSIEAAVASANHAVLLKLIPVQKDAIEAEYVRAIAAIADGAKKAAGISVGEQSAVEVMKYRSDDDAFAVETFRPNTQPGTYVPTAIPVFSLWSKRRPWAMTSADQFRPGPPPDLKSDIWARDYNEIKSMGVKTGSKRTDEQTAIASFWETTGGSVYMPVILSVANAGNREVTQNARLIAMVSQAMDDAVIAVFDAKWAYKFWRPVTAIRNGDIDGNDATERDPSWVPFIETPMHPEYPCAHCIVASTIGTVLQLELGDTPLPPLSSVSPTLPGATRRWTTIDGFVREVSEARICDGVHFRNSTEVANVMGKKVGELTFSKFAPPK
ncbi:MAG: vanadium-dependent haloperoxidase [Pyrinomonadaceae bacterium]